MSLTTFTVKRDDQETSCKFTDEALIVRNSEEEEKLDITDIIGVKIDGSFGENENNTTSVTVHAIQRLENYKWTTKKLKLETDIVTATALSKTLQGRLDQFTTRPKRLLVILNPVSGNHTSESDFKTIVKPIFETAGITTEVIVSDCKDGITNIMETYDDNKVDGFVVFGGDGSFHQVAVPLLERKQRDGNIDLNHAGAELKPVSKPIAVIPSGTGNSLSKYLYGIPDIETAALHIVKGQTRKLGATAVYNNGQYVKFYFLAFGFGLTMDFFYYSEYLRWMGKLRYLLFPIIYFLFRPYPVYHVNVITSNRNDNTENSISEQDVTGDFDGQFISFIAIVFDMTDKDLRMDADHWKIDEQYLSISSNAYPSKFTVLKNFLKTVILRSVVPPQSYTKKFYGLNGYRITSSDKTKINSSLRINFDGEHVNIDTINLDARYKGPLLTVYSSLEERTKN